MKTYSNRIVFYTDDVSKPDIDEKTIRDPSLSCLTADLSLFQGIYLMDLLFVDTKMILMALFLF